MCVRAVVQVRERETESLCVYTDAVQKAYMHYLSSTYMRYEGSVCTLVLVKQVN